MIYRLFCNQMYPCIQQSMSIWVFLYNVIREAKVSHALITNVVLIVGLAYMIFQQSLLMQADLDVYSTVMALGWYAMIERLLKASNELVVAYFIMLPFRLAAEKSLVETFVVRSPASLLLMRENAYALKSAGLRALEALVENGLSVITPIVLLVSRSAALSATLNGMQLFIVIVCLSCVFMLGLAILAYDHRKKEILSKKETEVAEQGRSLMTSVATLVVNGLGETLPDWMTTLKKEEYVPSTRHDVIMAVMYGSLEIATTGIPVALVWMIKGEGAFLSLYIIIQPMFWNSWYLFWKAKSLVVSTAPWTQYADFMKNSTPHPRDLVAPDAPRAMMPIFETGISEVELCGPSGCGKTTLMRRIIAEICGKYVIGHIVYIEQFACLPLEQQISEYYAAGFPEGRIPINFEEELLERAIQLGISNVINGDTLKKSFSKPSGGEKKRIIFLKHMLPILMGESKVMIAFLDEVSAGLDVDSFAKVRAIIEEVKGKGVKVVSIDHHEHEGKNTLKVQVFKRVYRVHRKLLRKVPSFWHRIVPRVYHKTEEETDLEQGEEQTEIEVWAPALGMEAPDSICTHE
jgi:Fe-S cluster assembly ATPase SufC